MDNLRTTTIALYDAGASIIQIVQDLGVSSGTVYRWVKSADILRSPSDAQALRRLRSGANAVCNSCGVKLVEETRSPNSRKCYPCAALTFRKYYARVKEEVLRHYGNGWLACVVCGYTDDRALSIDHIDNNGAKERKGINPGRFYFNLRNQNYPEGYQTLCMNCQWVKEAERRMETYL